uniref:bactericidal permeability-increasing protein-like isoform X1 n=2 Tax=Myxine glutinosa TaxID=7769 RepID=UPI00358E3D8B
MTNLQSTRHLFSFLLLSLLLLLLLRPNSATNPGFKVRITNAGLQYAKDTGVSVLSQKLKTLHIPDMSGKKGVFSYKVYQISLQELSLPTSDILPVPGTGLKVSIANGFFRLSGRWSYKALFVRDSGSFDLSLNSVGLTTVLRFTKDVGGRPTVQAVGCSATVGDVHVKLHGGASWFYNLFRGPIGHNIRDNLKRQICPMVTNSVDKGLNEILQTFPVKKNVDEFVMVDYSLTRDPEFLPKAVDLSCKGSFKSISHPVEPPFTALPMNMDNATDKMLYLGVSEYLFNTAGFAFHSAGALNYLITNDMIPKESPFRLDTSSIGRFIPEVQKQYPNMLMEMRMLSNAPPAVTIQPKTTNLSAYADILTFAILPNGSRAFLFSLNVSATMDAKLAFAGPKLKGVLDLKSLLMKQLNSTVGTIPVASIKLGVLFILHYSVLPKVNDRLNKGIPLPDLKGVEIINPLLRSEQACVLIGLNLKYLG